MKSFSRRLGPLVLVGILLCFGVQAQVPSNGLVAYYPFNGNANDESGNAKNGIVYAAVPINDRFGYDNRAYSFDGASSFIDVSSIGNVGSNTVTYSAWVFPLRTDGGRGIILRGTLDYGVTFGIVNGQVWVGGSTSGWNETYIGNVPSNCWTHLAATYDQLGQQINVYINGTLQGTAHNSFLIDGAGFITHIGTNQVPPECNCYQWFSGVIDDMRIYNRALDASEISSLYHEGGWPIPVSSLPFSDGFESGNFASGRWTVAGNVSIVNSPVYSGSYAAMISAQHLLEKQFLPVSTGQLTWTFWVQVPQTGSNFNFHLTNTDHTYGVAVGIRSDANFWAANGALGPATQPDVKAYTANTWYKITIVANLSTQKYDAYINDELIVHQWNFFGTGTAITVASFNGLDWGTAYYDDVSVSLLTNNSPIANAGPDRTVECTSCCSTAVQLDGTASKDPDGDVLSYTWTGPFGTATGPTPTVLLPLGANVITLNVDDGRGGTSSAQATIRVVDTTPPTITLNPSVSLWPPNHKYSTFKISDMVKSVSDLCAGSIPVSSVVIVSASSDEQCDGIAIGTDCRSVQLRAERDGSGNGRVYKVRLAVSDPSGNVGSAVYVVTVPHDQGAGSIAFDDGDVCTVFGQCMPAQPQMDAMFQGKESPASANAGLSDVSDAANYPNPFNPSTTIVYKVTEPTRVDISIFNSIGQTVRRLVDEDKAPGVYSVVWDGKTADGESVASGIYVYQVKTKSRTLNKTMLMLK